MGLFDGTPGPLSQVSVVALDWPATEGSAMGALLTLRWGGVRCSLGGSTLIFAPCPDCFSLCWLVCAPCSHLATEMTKCRGELVTKELELKRLRRDVNIKASQISRMEESFHCMKEELDSKTELGAWNTLCVFFVFFLFWGEKSCLCMVPPNFALSFGLCPPQRSIWRTRSTAARRTSWTTWSVSRCWKGSCRRCGGSWPTRWSSCRSSETFSKELRPSRTTDRPLWTNWLCSLGEDTTVTVWKLSFCSQGQAALQWWGLPPRARTPSESTAVFDTAALWMCTTNTPAVCVSGLSSRLSRSFFYKLLFSDWIMICVHFYWVNQLM